MSKPDCLPCAALAYTHFTFEFENGEQTMAQRQDTYDNHIHNLPEQLNDLLFDNRLQKSHERWREGSKSQAVLLHGDWIPHVIPGNEDDSDDGDEDELFRVIVGFAHHPVADWSHLIWACVEDYDGALVVDAPDAVLERIRPMLRNFDVQICK